MRKFGSPVNLWEGSTHREGYFKYAKPKITSVQLSNWQPNVHNKLLEDISMDRVVLESTSESESYHLMKHLREEKLKNISKVYNGFYICFQL